MVRWLNGSFFAGTYALSHTMQLLRTEHSFGRKITLMFQALYNLLTLLFTWFGYVLQTKKNKKRLLRTSFTDLCLSCAPQNGQLLDLLHGPYLLPRRSQLQLTSHCRCEYDCPSQFSSTRILRAGGSDPLFLNSTSMEVTSSRASCWRWEIDLKGEFLLPSYSRPRRAS